MSLAYLDCEGRLAIHHEHFVSPSDVMCLRALLRVCRAHQVGRMKDLAEELGVTEARVCTTLNHLQERGSVELRYDGGVLLTPSGIALAHCVVRRFETLKTLLLVVLGFDEVDAERDAIQMEQAVSLSTLNRMAGFLERLEEGRSVELDDLRETFRAHPVACSE